MEVNGDLQASVATRSRRPESSLSSRSKPASQSSNSSSANLQHRAHPSLRDRDMSQEWSQTERRGAPGASLLQERLKERRAAKQNEQRRSADVDAMFEDSGIHSSPKLGASSGPGKEREGRPSSSGERVPGKKGMGIKEMEETVSTLHKQNFDLKLELYHRRQREVKLEAQLEAAESARISEQAELQSVNEQLLAELEKRDKNLEKREQALEEAMDVICSLEDKIERLMQERDSKKSINIQSGSRDFLHAHEMDGQSTQVSSSPPHRDELDSMTLTRPMRPKARHVARMPSFLSEQSEGTEALRSLYLPFNQESQSMQSLPKVSEDSKDEAEETEAMNSPRLSVLSESSFLSVYGEKRLVLDELDLNGGAEGESPDYRRHRKSLSIERWNQERANAAKAAPKRPLAPKSTNMRNGQFLSINNIIESPLQRLEKLDRAVSKQNRRHTSILPAELEGDGPGVDQGKKGGNLRRIEMSSFENEHGLPPTPDTISTSTLRKFKNSEDSYDSLSYDSVDRGQARGQLRPDGRNMTSSFSNLLNARPHSAGETVTSRREGHGWDTVTQSEVTDTTDEVRSLFDPWLAMGREQPRPRVQVPDMFTFSDSDEEDWGRDAMFNRDSGPQLPPLKPYDRRDLQDRIPRSEDTVIAPFQVRRSHSIDSSSPQYPPPCPPLSTQYSPNPPERRSSLAAASPLDRRHRKPAQQVRPSISYPIAQPGLRAASMTINVNQPQNLSKRARITSKLFGGLGRLETSQSANSGSSSTTASSIPAAMNNNAHRTQSFNRSSNQHRRNSVDLSHTVEALQRASATPPPILRYPQKNTNTAVLGAEIVRPLTASSLESNLRDRRDRRNDRNNKGGYDDGFGVDGAGDDRSGAKRGVNVSVGVGVSVNANESRKDGKPQGRKWPFGLGRTASLSVRR